MITFSQILARVDGRVGMSREFNTTVDKVVGYNELFQTAVFYDPIQGIEATENADLELSEPHQNYEHSSPGHNADSYKQPPSTIQKDNSPAHYQQQHQQVQYQQNMQQIQPPQLQNYQNNPHIDLYNTDLTPKNPLDTPMHGYYESPVLPSSARKAQNTPYDPDQNTFRPHNDAGSTRRTHQSHQSDRQIEGQNNMNVIKLGQVAPNHHNMTPNRSMQNISSISGGIPMGMGSQQMHQTQYLQPQHHQQQQHMLQTQQPMYDGQQYVQNSDHQAVR